MNETYEVTVTRTFTELVNAKSEEDALRIVKEMDWWDIPQDIYFTVRPDRLEND